MRNLRHLNSAVRQFALCGILVTAVLQSHAQQAHAKGPDTAAASESSKGDSATTEANTPAEKRASKLVAEATGVDFRAKRFAAGEKKLREAIQICMVQTCSTAYRARLHRDLGYIYVAGMKHVEDGKDEFTAALTIDAAVSLSPEMEEQAGVKQAFDEVKAEMNGPAPSSESREADAKPAKKDLSSDGPSEHDHPGEPEKEAERGNGDGSAVVIDSFPKPAENAKRTLLNWFSLAIEQDLILHSNTMNACSSGSRYQCFDRQNRWYPVNDFEPGGNQVSAGVAAGTWRVLLGYDRSFANRFTLGARAGTVVAGKAEMVAGERKFLYLHAEARAAAWLARNPFFESGIQPYLFVSGGAAEADGKVVVQVSFDRCPNCKLNAWKRSGNVFVGAGAGVKWAITPNSGPVLEARYLQFFNPLLPAIGIQLGYAIGI